MGASEGVFQTEREFKIGAGDFALLAGARYHPFSLRSVLYERQNLGAVDLFLEVVDGDRVYQIDSATAMTDRFYSWPNTDSPEKFDLTPPQRVRLRVIGGANPAENQSAAITWAELGAP